MSAEETPAYTKLVDATSITETHHIPITTNILPHEDTWQTHPPETASLSNTSPIAVKSVISTDAGHYVNQHNVDQHNYYLDYSDTRNKGFATGPTTGVTWNQSHQGNRRISHAGVMTQNRQVHTENTTIQAPNIHYQYGNRNTIMRGNTFSQSTINATTNTRNEQSIINHLTESAPAYTETVGQSTEAYMTQHFNYHTVNMLADQFNHNGILMIDAEDHFDLADFMRAAQSTPALILPVYTITINIDSALFVSVAPSGLICIVKFSMAGQVQTFNANCPVEPNSPDIQNDLKESAQLSFAQLITSMKIADIGDTDSHGGSPVDTNLQLVSVTLKLIDGEEFSCTLSMTAPNVYTIDTETLNFKSHYNGWDFEGSTDFTADIIFVGWNSAERMISVAKPSSALNPYPYNQKAASLIHTATSFIKSQEGNLAIQAGIESGGNPQLALFDYALHESIKHYGVKKTIKIAGIAGGLLLAAPVLYFAAPLAIAETASATAAGMSIFSFITVAYAKSVSQ